MTLLFGLIFVGLVGAAAAWRLSSKRVTNDAWRAFAAARQLSFARGQIAGVISGTTVVLLIENRGDTERSHQVAVARCSLDGAVPPGFRLSRQSLLDKVGQLVSGADHQLGNAKMDEAFRLENLGDEARRVLSKRSVQEALLAAVERYPELFIGNGVLQLESARIPSTEDGLATMVNDAVTLATTLQRASRR